MYYFCLGNSVLSSCSSIKLCGGDGVRFSRSCLCLKIKQIFRDFEEEVSVCFSEGKEIGVRFKDISRSCFCLNIKQICIDCDCYDDEEEEEVSFCFNEGKRMRFVKENDALKVDEGKRVEKEEGLKRKNERGWIDEFELVLEGVYLIVKLSFSFWKKVFKMVFGKLVQECFDRVNVDFIIFC